VESLNRVYRKDISKQEVSSYTINSPKEKKMVVQKSMLKFPFLNSFLNLLRAENQTGIVWKSHEGSERRQGQE
jgi:hypothetical protein